MKIKCVSFTEIWDTLEWNVTYVKINQQYIPKTDKVSFSILYPRKQKVL